MFGVKGFLVRGLWRFDLFTRTLDYGFPLSTRLGMTLQIDSFCESGVTMHAGVRFRQLCDVFDQESVALKNPNRHDVLQLRCRVSCEMPHPFGLGHINPYSQPISECGPVVQVPLHLVQLI